MKQQRKRSISASEDLLNKPSPNKRRSQRPEEERAPPDLETEVAMRFGFWSGKICIHTYNTFNYYCTQGSRAQVVQVFERTFQDASIAPTVSRHVEEALFNLHARSASKEYKSHARNVLANLKRNAQLRESLLKGNIVSGWKLRASAGCWGLCLQTI